MMNAGPGKTIIAMPRSRIVEPMTPIPIRFTERAVRYTI
jgi:hypothetical protein